jgi:hypothetical protein
MQEYSLGRALCLEATGGLAYAYSRAWRAGGQPMRVISS